MSKLKNPKHDAFARLLAKGWKQVPAYKKVYAPDGDCRAAASRLAKRPDVVELVKSIQEDEAAKIFAAMGNNGGSTLSEIGLTPEWVATQFKVVAARALAASDFKASTDATRSLEKMIRDAETRGSDAPKTSSAKIDLESMMTILSKLAAPTVKIIDDQSAKDAEVSPMAWNRAHRAAARDEQ